MDKEELKKELKEKLGVDLNEKDLKEIISTLNTFNEIEEEEDDEYTGEDDEDCVHNWKQKFSYNLGCKGLMEDGYYCTKCLSTVKEEGEN